MSTTTASPTTCPDLEELAAFVDGQLSARERDAVVEHLGSCEDCYEVYAETLRVQKDLGLQAEPPEVTALEDEALADDASAADALADEPAELAPVVVHPRSLRWMWKAGTTLAAAAALTLMVRTAWFTPGEYDAPLTAADLSIMMARPVFENSEWSEHRWPRKRGTGPALSASQRDSHRRAFRIGVHAIDLRASIQLGDMDLASTKTRHIEKRLGEIDLSQPWIWGYQDLRRQIEDDVGQKELLESCDRLGNELTDDDAPLVDPFFFHFGRWTEASRLAVLSEYPEYFSRREFRRSLRRLQKKELSERVLKEVQKIEGLVETGSGDLRSVLEEIIRLEGVR